MKCPNCQTKQSKNNKKCFNCNYQFVLKSGRGKVDDFKMQKVITEMAGKTSDLHYTGNQLYHRMHQEQNSNVGGCLLSLSIITAVVILIIFPIKSLAAIIGLPLCAVVFISDLFFFFSCYPTCRIYGYIKFVVGYW